MEIVFSEQFMWFLVLATLWTLPWKGFALWFAVKEGQKWWFIALLVVNTFAILEIVYIFFVVKKGKELKRALGFK